MANVNFKDFCNVLEDIKTHNDRQYKIKTLQLYYFNLRNIPSINTLYPIMRLLLPSMERGRSYGMKEEALRRKIIKILCLNKDSSDSINLANTHDFPEAAYNVLRKYYGKGVGLNIGEINTALNDIASKNNADDVLSTLFKKTSPFEQKWLIRIILKNLHLGLGEKKLLTLFHPDAINLFDKTNDLERVCLTFHDKNVHLNEIEIAIFNAFCPMLSKRCDTKELFKAVAEDKLMYVENKFDGERFQLHMDEGTFKYFSRRGFDFTAKFGHSYKTGIFTPLLKNTFKSNVKRIILDGEMMIWDSYNKKFGSKGMNVDVKNLTDTSFHQPCFCVFDILLLNDQVLTQKPLCERKDILKSIIVPTEGVIMLSEIKEVYGKEAVVKALNDSAVDKEEGIVFKRPDSLYVANSRNHGWWKMKLEYFADVMTDLDVIIMGGYLNQKGNIDKVLVGVAVPSKRGSHPTIFHSLSTIYTGLNANEWKELNEMLKNKLNKTTMDKSHETFGLIFGKKKPDVWIKPEESCLLEVRASELIKTKSNSDYKTDYTLRFARIQKLRFDKPYYDCLTTVELENLTTPKTYVEKLFKRKLNLEDLEYDMKKAKKIRSKYNINEVIVEEAVSNVFTGKEFCVWSGDEKHTKEDMERIIKENGGSITKIESAETFCILAAINHERIKYYKGNVDVVKVNWVFTSINEGKFVDYTPLDMIFTTNRTKNSFMESFDKFGDSFCKEITKNELKEIEKNIDNRLFYIRPLPNEITEFHVEIQLNKNFRIFYDYVAYFCFNCKVDELEFKFWGGKVSNLLNESVNLIIVDSMERMEKIQKTHNIKVVFKDFIKKSIDKYLEEIEF